MTDALDFDPTFELDPEDYAQQLDDLATKKVKRGAYEEATLLTCAAKWLRKMDEEREP